MLWLLTLECCPSERICQGSVYFIGILLTYSPLDGGVAPKRSHDKSLSVDVEVQERYEIHVLPENTRPKGVWPHLQRLCQCSTASMADNNNNNNSDNTVEGANPWANEYPSKGSDETAATAPRLGLPNDFGSLSLDPSHENQDIQQHQTVSASDDSIWNLDRAAWADAPLSSSYAPEPSSSAAHPLHVAQPEVPPKPQASQVASEHPPSGPPAALSNRPSLSPLPALNLDSFKQVFSSSSASRGEVLTPASATEAQPVSPDKEVSRQAHDTSSSPASGSGTPVTSTSTLRPVPSSSAPATEAAFDFRRFQQQMSSVRSCCTVHDPRT